MREGLGPVEEHIRILWLAPLTTDIKKNVLDSIRVFAIIILSFLSSIATSLILCVCSLDHCGCCTLCIVLKAQDTQMHYLHMQMLCFHVQMTTNPRTMSTNDSASKIILLLIRG